MLCSPITCQPHHEPELPQTACLPWGLLEGWGQFLVTEDAHLSRYKTARGQERAMKNENRGDPRKSG